jgi:uncharacterized oxidoreductase
MKITGNTVLITGGASGIGLALARAFLEQTNTVIVCGRNLEKLDGVRRECPGIHTIQCDVSNPVEVAQMVGQVASDFPALNILVNNAGIQHRCDFLRDGTVLQKIDEEIDINFRAVARLTSILLPGLARLPEAAIVNVSSFLGIVPKGSAPVYCATKAALHVFSVSLRYQLKDAPVKVFEIIAPLVNTGMTREGEAGAEKMEPDVLAGILIQNMKKDRYEIMPGKTKLLLFLNRFAPALIQNRVGKR